MDFNMTVGALLGLIATAGVPALVNYVLAQFPALDDKLKKAIQTVAVATMVAFVTAVAAVLPQAWLDEKLLAAAIAVIGVVVSWAGSFFGLKHGEVALAERIESAAAVAWVEGEDVDDTDEADA